ncbi:MAG TPA: hypothetical protein QGG47_07290 [Acidobacteriota bacterium]|nr:hypothetical protein [Acidobacteriota bacterium]
MLRQFRRLEREPYASWWTDRFGTPVGLFDGCSMWQRGKSSVWVAALDVDPGATSPVDGVGFPLLRVGGRAWKPTSVGLVHFGLRATRNVVELDANETMRFLAGEAIELATDDPRCGQWSRGFVLARYLGVPLGCAEWRADAIRSVLPKGRRNQAPDLPLSIPES